MGTNTMKLLVSLLLVISLISLTSADLGTFKQNECVALVVPLNASSVTLTNVNSPSPNSTVLLTNKAMTANGNFFNYTFCNTTTLGVYTYGYCSNTGLCFGNDFTISGSGQVVTQQQINLIGIGLAVMVIIIIFFFILSLIFKHPGTKLFFMGMSCATLVFLIGLITSNAAIYLAEFPTLAAAYDKYYILTLILSGASMLAAIIWLIYYGLNLFNKSRGTVEDDD